MINRNRCAPAVHIELLNMTDYVYRVDLVEIKNIHSNFLQISPGFELIWEEKQRKALAMGNLMDHIMLMPAGRYQMTANWKCFMRIVVKVLKKKMSSYLAQFFNQPSII